MLRALVTASAVFAAGSFASRAAKLLLIPVIVRYLTPAEVGIVVFLEAIMLACGRFFPLGLGQAVRRFYGEFADRADADAYARMLWRVSLGFGAAGMLVLGAAVLLLPSLFSAQVPGGLIFLALIAGVLRSAQSIPLQRFIARSEPARHGLFEYAEFVSTTGLVILLIAVAGWGVEGYLWGSIISAGAWAGIYGLVMSAGPRRHPGYSNLRLALQYSLPLWPHLLFTWAITFLDRLVLERMVPLAEVGVYGIGYQLASVIPVVTLAVTNAWLPRYFASGGTISGRRDYLRVLNLYCGFIALLVLGVFLIAPEIVRIVATPGFARAAGILQIVAIGMAYHAAYQALLLVLFYEKKGHQVSLATGFGLAANVLGLVILVPRFGIAGAAWATVLAFWVATAWSATHARSRLGASVSDILRALAPVFVTTVLLAAAVALRAEQIIGGGRATVAVLLVVLTLGAVALSIRRRNDRPLASAG